MREVKKRTFRQALFAVLFSMMILFNTSGVLAAEVKVDPGTSIADAPELQCGQEYYSTKAATTEYFKFTTPDTGHGYYKIVFTNISVSDDLYGSIIKESGIVAGETQNMWSTNSSRTWLLDLEAGQTYYIKTWGEVTGGNYGLYLERYADTEGTSKEDGAAIKLNTEYTFRKELDADVDYAVFTANTSGTYRMTFTNIGGGDLYASMHAFDSDRQNGDQINVWRANQSSYRDYTLEAGVKYYIKITGDTDNAVSKYGLIVSNQKAQQIRLSNSSLVFEDTYDYYDLTAQVLPTTTANKAVTWSSSNEDVATVDSDGSVCSRGVGRAVITCAATDGSGARAQCVVIVKPGKVYSFYDDTQTAKSITLTWSKISGANGYTIYQYNTKTRKWKALKNVNATSYKVTGLKSGTTYKFYLAAYVQNGTAKIYGPNTSTLTTSTLPSRPTIKKIKQKGRFRSWYAYYRKLTVETKKVSGANGYQLAYSTSKNGSYYTVSTKGKTKLNTTVGFRCGRKFYFKVRAYRKVDGKYYYGEWSKPKKAKIK